MSTWTQRPYGDRFVYRYHEHKEKSKIKRFVNIFAGLAILIIGIPLIPLPGPGWVVIFFGLGLISGEILWLAKFLDFLDGTLVKWLVAWYTNSRWSLLLAIFLFAAACVVAAWIYGPAWHIGNYQWGNMDDLKDLLKEAKSKF